MAHDIYTLTDQATVDEAMPRRWKWREPVGYLCLRGVQQVAAQLTGETAQVLLALLCAGNYRNQCTLTFRVLGARAGVSASGVSRSIRRLRLARCLVVQRAPEAHAWLITLSPWLVWRGRPWQVQAARAQFEALWQQQQAACGAGTLRAPSPGAGGSHASQAPSTPHPNGKMGANPFTAYPPRRPVNTQ
jgi:hypothetical protein